MNSSFYKKNSFHRDSCSEIILTNITLVIFSRIQTKENDDLHSQAYICCFLLCVLNK